MKYQHNVMDFHGRYICLDQASDCLFPQTASEYTVQRKTPYSSMTFIVSQIANNPHLGRVCQRVILYHHAF
jgi:hypothetical protein